MRSKLARHIDDDNSNTASHVLRHKVTQHFLHLRCGNWPTQTVPRIGYQALSVATEPKYAIDAEALGLAHLTGRPTTSLKLWIHALEYESSDDGQRHPKYQTAKYQAALCG